MAYLQIGTSILFRESEILNTTRVSSKVSSNESQNDEKTLDNKSASTNLRKVCRRISQSVHGLSVKHGVHSNITMISAGFTYTSNGDVARCNLCGLEISEWTLDMKPFTIHKQRSPTCGFVLSILSSEKTTTNPSIKLIETTSTSNIVEQPLKRLKTDTTVTISLPNTLIEVDSLKQVRKRGFSHWPHRSSPSASQMIEAGFFNCNVGDRVICIYCNIICQQWTPNNDDPCEVHKTLSPKCPYIIAMLITSSTSYISIINEASTSVDPIRCQAIVNTAACNPNYGEISNRYASFATWPNENLPPVDDLVKAGFFFSGAKTIVICFYCNGSLQNWGANDNPTIEHAHRFPHCAYAKQLCGAELHRKIQESKRVQQEKARGNNADNLSAVGIGNSNDGGLLIPDESILSEFVAARLDLPISQSLLDRNFKLSVIKRCWEDQLRLKHVDFASDSDLLMACKILQKQMECINGKKENILVPSLVMNRIREQEETEVRAGELTISASSSINSSDNGDGEMTSISPTHTDNGSNLNPCKLCLANEWYIALLPCAHVHTDIFPEHLP